MISSRTQLNAVIGYPLTHSKSPALHNALYKKLGINAIMRAFSQKSVARLINKIRKLNIGLTAVTMPFKQAAIPYLDKIDRQARTMDAVNTIINNHGILTGFNTDIDGIACALKNVPLKSKNVLLVGAGGAARAVAYYLKSKEAKIFYQNRTKYKAYALVKKFGGKIISAKELSKMKMHVIINATPIGMTPKTGVSPLSKYKFKKYQVVFDLVYNPRQTQLLKQAKKAGAKTISGVEMFIGQALKQVELYSGKIKNNSIKTFAGKLLAKG